MLTNEMIEAMRDDAKRLLDLLDKPLPNNKAWQNLVSIRITNLNDYAAAIKEGAK